MSIDLPMIQFSSASNPPHLSSLASSNLNFLNSANEITAPLKQSCAASCSSHANTCRKLESVEGTGDKRASGSSYNTVFYSVPSKIEVQNSVAALQNFLLGISSASSGPELKWLQPLLGSCDLLTQGYGMAVDTFRLLLTDPSVKRLAVSLSSDEAVWDAVMNNELVRKLRHSPFLAGTPRLVLSDKEPNLGSDILRWILEITKAKVMELIDKFQLLMNEVFSLDDKGKASEETLGPGNLEDKLRSSLLLSLVILLIVILGRLHGA